MKRPTIYAAGIVALLVVIAGGVLAALFLFRREPVERLPEPGAPIYEDYVRSFYLGVAGLDTDLTDLARKELSRAIELIPEEPAAWANRGLLYLRANQLEFAEPDLRHAHELAPDSGEIRALLGLLAQRQGKFSEAVAQLRAVVESNPQDLASRFALAQAILQEAGPNSDAEYQKLLEECLEIEPYNLRVLREVAISAVNRRDPAALEKVLERYRKLSPDWSRQTRQQFAVVEKAAEGPLPGQVAAALQTLDRVLMTERSYLRDALAVEPKPENVGQPLYKFLSLAPPPPSRAEPDLQLAFAEQAKAWPAEIAGSQWSQAWAVWLSGEDDRPAVFVANGKELRRADAPADAHAFPGGPAATPPSRSGLLPVDWNSDYRTDLVLAGAGGLRFLLQDDRGGFQDVSAKTGLGEDILAASAHGAWACDVETDGDLDIVLAPATGTAKVLRNNSDGTFLAQEPFEGAANVRAFAWADWDNDGASDVAFLDADGRLAVFANQRAGLFQRRETPEDLGRLLAIATADLNDDGVFDLVALQADSRIVRLSDERKGQGWEWAEVAAWTRIPGDIKPGAAELFAADLDNNGGLDLLATAAASGQAWLCGTDGKFSPLPAALPGAIAALADWNADARLDALSLSSAGQPLELLTQGSKAYHWEIVRTRAAPGGDGRINSFGVGGDVELRSGLLVQKQPIDGPRLHFGLGERERADLLRIVWPNGTFQVEFDKPADEIVEAEQRLKGSCPFLFAWDGGQMRLVTDCLWSTPLGMHINGQAQGRFLQTTEWVKVRGDQLAPRDGVYDLRVQANLWETHFYDHMALGVVDHPPGTEVFVDERFAVTPTTPQVHVTGPVQPVASAIDDRGTNVTEIVRQADGRYLDTFGRGRYQGVARDHWVEIDLGEAAPSSGPLWLIAQGWVHPTDSSINVAMEQGRHERPQMLSLEVPNGSGGWKVAVPALGFPAGKNKTMLIRLDGVDGPGVIRRLRLRTNLEVFWDFLGFAPGLDSAEVRQTWLAPNIADLRFRGILRMSQANSSSPEVAHYDDVVQRGQHWRDLEGFYTRFGDVRELLAQVDDRYVIMNAGDEIAFQFQPPPEPPAGWKRDFVWACDGWTKDGDLNTRFSRTVLPLPSHDSVEYSTPPGRLEDDPVYRRFPEDWQRYHTRYVTSDAFERGLRARRPPRSQIGVFPTPPLPLE